MFFEELFSNKILISAMISWFVAQALKVVFYYIKHHKFDISKFFSSGSMPSSHSAFVTALVVAVGMVEGVGSTFFAMRRAAGRQARIINQIVLDFYKEKQVKTEKLKELLGHTPLEVFVGAILGGVIAWMECMH